MEKSGTEQFVLKVDSLAGKVDSLGGVVEALTGKVDSLGGVVDDLAGKVDSLGGVVEDLARMTAEGFSSMEKRMDSLETEVRSTNQHIDRIVMPLLDSHAYRIKGLEVKLA